jgi:hypothetical protein
MLRACPYTTYNKPIQIEIKGYSVMVGGVSCGERVVAVCALLRDAEQFVCSTSIITHLATPTTIIRALHCLSFMLTDEVTLVYI